MIASTLSQDPCELVSNGDVEMATGARVQSSGPVPDEAMIVPGGPPLCEYEVPGRHATIIVAVDPTGADGLRPTAGSRSHRTPTP